MGQFSESLRKAIRGSGLSQAEIAKRAGIDQSQLSRFLSGDRTLTLETVDRVSAVLGWKGDPPEYIPVQVTASSGCIARKTVPYGFGSIWQYVAITKPLKGTNLLKGMILLWAGESLPDEMRSDFSRPFEDIRWPSKESP